MKTSFEIIEARLMYEINQLKAMIYILLPNKATNYQYNSYSYGSPYNQPIFHQSVYPINANSFEQTTYGSQHYNQPVTDSSQPTNIPQTQHPTSTNNSFGVKSTSRPVIEKASTSKTTTTESRYRNISLIPEVNASFGGVTEKILEFKPVQTKSLNRFRSRHHK